MGLHQRRRAYGRRPVFLPFTTETDSKRWPLANLAIIALTCLLHLVIEFRSEWLSLTLSKGLILFRGEGFQLRQLLGSVFTHSSFGHLFGNMFLLLVLGNPVNRRLGHLAYTALYLALGLASSLVWLGLGSGFAVVGASGAVMGILGAYFVLFPTNRIQGLISWLSFALIPVLVIVEVGGIEGLLPLTALFLSVYVIGVIYFLRRDAAGQGSLFGDGLLTLLGLRMVRLTGIWLVLLTVGADVVYLVSPVAGDRVAHESHLGGFVAGFAVLFLCAARGWVAQRPQERTLWDLLRGRKAPEPIREDLVPVTVPATRRYARATRVGTQRQVPFEQWAAQTRRLRGQAEPSRAA